MIPAHDLSIPLPAVGSTSWCLAQMNAQRSDIATYTTRLEETKLMRLREEAILGLIPARVTELNNTYNHLMAFKRKVCQTPRMFHIKATGFEIEFFSLKNERQVVTTALRDRAGNAVNNLLDRLGEKERQTRQCDMKLDELREKSKMLSDNREHCMKTLAQLEADMRVDLRL